MFGTRLGSMEFTMLARLKWSTPPVKNRADTKAALRSTSLGRLATFLPA